MYVLSMRGNFIGGIFYFAFKHYDFYLKIRVEDRKKLIKEYIELMYK